MQLRGRVSIRGPGSTFQAVVDNSSFRGQEEVRRSGILFADLSIKRATSICALNAGSGEVRTGRIVRERQAVERWNPALWAASRTSRSRRTKRRARPGSEHSRPRAPFLT